jgi:hypothetical protein
VDPDPHPDLYFDNLYPHQIKSRIRIRIRIGVIVELAGIRIRIKKMRIHDGTAYTLLPTHLTI